MAAYPEGMRGDENGPGNSEHQNETIPTNSSATVDVAVGCNIDASNAFLVAIGPIDASADDTVDLHSHLTPHTPLNFETSSDYAPPITARSLSELKISRIISNPKLRHDINFDPNLHFRPTTDGERCHFNRVQAETYWVSLTQELETCAVPITALHRRTSSKLLRVERLFCEMGEILGSLVPDRDKQIVKELCDVRLLMQHLQTSSLDYAQLATKLANILKAHCAPMRDQLVDEMVEQFTQATQLCNLPRLVEGIRQLLGILEAMKLDVANHQVRNLRPMLIEDTVNFEKRYFGERLLDGRIDAYQVLRWYSSVQSYWDRLSFSVRPPSRHEPFAPLLRAVVEMLKSSIECPLPSHFEFDTGRIRALRSDVKSFICLMVCISVFRRVVAEYFGLGCNPSQRACLKLRRVIHNLIYNNHSNLKWFQEVESISLEIGRHAQREVSADACPSSETICFIEECLRRNFQPHSPMWQEQEHALQEELWRQTFALTKGYLSTTIVTVADVATAPSSSPISPSVSTSPCNSDSIIAILESSIHDIAKRIAHIVCLHWQIFGPLVYSQLMTFTCEDRNAQSHKALDPLLDIQ
ncbi:MAG: hypothetical protein M1833_005317 [Piccolia ochrophora]|nr:MAG: hypothetical protein M1833_005317 [Piccolia ochrophora]